MIIFAAARKSLQKKKIKKKPKLPKIEKNEIPKEKITTAIDKMVEILEKKGSMNINELSKTLRVPLPTIEEWAKVLEEKGLVKLEYPTFGKPILRWIKTKIG